MPNDRLSGGAAMTVRFFDRQDRSNPLNGAAVGSRDELHRILDRVQRPESIFCELVCDNGYTLLLGLGPTVGCAQFSPSDGSTPYLVAMATDSNGESPPTEFLSADTPTPVAARYCLPPGIARQVAAHFVETGDRWPGIAWDEI